MFLSCHAGYNSRFLVPIILVVTITLTVNAHHPGDTYDRPKYPQNYNFRDVVMEANLNKTIGDNLSVVPELNGNGDSKPFKDQNSFQDKAFYNTSGANVRETQQSMVGAVYFMTNDPRGNSVVSTSILPDGRLGFSKSFRTGGFGGYNFFNPVNMSGVPHGLASQNSIIVEDDVLFTVNAGSNSISMFAIQRKLPTELSLVSSVSSGGEFPVALAFSRKLQMLCVLNGGARNGIQCYLFQQDELTRTPYLLPLPDVTKSMGLNLQTPPVYYDSVSDMIFTPDSSQLLVTVKGNPERGIKGFISSFPIGQGQIGNSVRNEPRGSATPYGMMIVPGTGISSEPILVFTDLDGGGFGMAKVEGSGVIRESAIIRIPGQRDTCWTAISGRSGHLFTADLAGNSITETALDINSLSAKILNRYNIPGSPVDMTVVNLQDKDVLYVLTPGLPVPEVLALSLEVPGHALIFLKYTPARAELDYPLNSGSVGMAHYLIH